MTHHTMDSADVAPPKVPTGVTVIGPIAPFRGGVAHYNGLLLESLRQCGRRTYSYSFARQYPRLLYPGRAQHDTSPTAAYDTETRYIIDSLNPMTWVRAGSQILSERPRITVFHWWTVFWSACFATIMGMVRHKGVPIVVICHNHADHDSGLFTHILSRGVLSLADGYLVHSKEQADLLRNTFPSKRIIHHIIPAYSDLPAPSSPLPKRGRLELLFFGFVRPYKGLAVLLEALTQVDDADVYLTIIGETWGRRLTPRETAGRSTVEIHPYFMSDTDAANYFDRADFVVLPYLTASGSAVASAALRYDTPIIASRVGGLPDVVANDVTGVLVPPGDAAALAGAISSVTRKDAQRLAEGVRALKARSNWETLGSALLNVLS